MVIGLVIKIALIIISILGAATVTSMTLNPEIGSSLLGSAENTSVTITKINATANNTNITGNAVGDIITSVGNQRNLLADFQDLLFSGVTGVAQALGNIGSVIITYIMRYTDCAGSPDANCLANSKLVSPDWAGWCVGVIILLLILWGTWNTLWSLGHNALTAFVIVILVVFALGIALKFLGLI